MPAPIPTRVLEQDLPGPIAQIDEVGRGPLCGPVCAAAVILPDTMPDDLAEIRDSKRLSPAKRERLAGRILEVAQTGIGLASAAEIDAQGIQAATFLAMTRALSKLPVAVGFVLIDGDRIPPGLTAPARAIVDGDALCTGIAAASIVAKVHRDRMIQEIARDYPVYGWDRNSGYGTREHIAALQEHGHTIHHRKSFGGVKGTKPSAVPWF